MQWCSAYTWGITDCVNTSCKPRDPGKGTQRATEQTRCRYCLQLNFFLFNSWLSLWTLLTRLAVDCNWALTRTSHTDTGILTFVCFVAKSQCVKCQTSFHSEVGTQQKLPPPYQNPLQKAHVVSCPATGNSVLKLGTSSTFTLLCNRCFICALCHIPATRSAKSQTPSQALFPSITVTEEDTYITGVSREWEERLHINIHINYFIKIKTDYETLAHFACVLCLCLMFPAPRKSSVQASPF